MGATGEHGLEAWESEGFFPGGALMAFPGGGLKHFARGANSGEI